MNPKTPFHSDEEQWERSRLDRLWEGWAGGRIASQSAKVLSSGDLPGGLMKGRDQGIAKSISLAIEG